MEMLPECKVLMENLDDGLKDIKCFREGVNKGFISVALAIAVQVISFAYMWGQLNETVRTNSQRIQYIEDIHPRTSNGIVRAAG